MRRARTASCCGKHPLAAAALLRWSTWRPARCGPPTAISRSCCLDQHDGPNTTVDSRATIDLAGFPTTIRHLNGAGRVTDSGAAATLTLSGSGSFAGSITGPLSLTVGGSVTITGASTFTGSTIINAGGTLFLGDGGTTGSISGGSAITNNGTLTIAAAMR